MTFAPVEHMNKIQIFSNTTALRRAQRGERKANSMMMAHTNLLPLLCYNSLLDSESKNKQEKFKRTILVIFYTSPRTQTGIR